MSRDEVLVLLAKCKMVKVWVQFGPEAKGDWVPLNRHRMKALLQAASGHERFDASTNEHSTLRVRHLGA